MDKLAKLLEIEGYNSLEEMAEAVFSDSISPGGEECCTNSVKSGLVLAGLM